MTGVKQIGPDNFFASINRRAPLRNLTICVKIVRNYTTTDRDKEQVQQIHRLQSAFGFMSYEKI